MKNQAEFCARYMFTLQNHADKSVSVYTSFITSSAFHNIIVQDNIKDDRSTCFPCTGNQNWRGRTDGRTDGARVGVRSREYQIFSDG